MIPSQDKCVPLIQSFEGCEKKRDDGLFEAYPDPGTGGAPWTIGWGTTDLDVGEGTIWTQEQCDDRFWHRLVDLAEDHYGEMEVVAPPPHDDDLPGAAEGVHRDTVTSLLDGAATTQDQFDALVALAYNVGLANLKRSTLLEKHKAGDHAGAAAEFAKWNKANGRVLAGLTRRRAAEAALYRGEA